MSVEAKRETGTDGPLLDLRGRTLLSAGKAGPRTHPSAIES